MRHVGRVLAKEPVLLGAIVLAVGDATFQEGSPWRAVVIAVVAWLVRMLSTPEQRAQQRIEEAADLGREAGRATAEADLRSLAPVKKAAPRKAAR